MPKADLVVLALAGLALVGTTVGVFKSSDWTDEATYEFSETLQPMPPQEARAAGTAPARFEVPVPANATGAVTLVHVDFAGQAVQGGMAVVRVGGTAPDGTPLPSLTRTLVVAQGATSASADFTYNATWLDLPGDVRDTRAPPGRTWERPLVLLVTVERPSDTAVATYSFMASIEGSLTGYASG